MAMGKSGFTLAAKQNRTAALRVAEEAGGDSSRHAKGCEDEGARSGCSAGSRH